jgi:plasmid stabilization system protein ParE
MDRMRAELRFRPEIELDVREAAGWYEERSQGLGSRFEQEVRAALNRVAERPEAFSELGPGVRHAVLNVFPYLVIFRQAATFVEIIAVIHGAREPSNWQRRVVEP